MINCKNCDFFNNEYNELRQQYNDTGDEKMTFCIAFIEGIPDKYRENKTRCPFLVEKTDEEN